MGEMVHGQYVSDEQLAEDTAQDMQQVLDECYKSKKRLAQVFFPEKFYLPFSDVIHDPIFDILDDKTIEKAVIVAPRGSGKTSLVNFLCAAQAILFQDYRYVVPVSCSSPHAIMQAENLKRELLTNRNVLSMFGSIRMHRDRVMEQFAKTQWLAELDDNFSTLVFPRGSGQQIRGLLYNSARPDLILVDDLEDPKKLLSDEQREQQRKWFMSDLCGAVPDDKPYRIIVLGSLLHQDCLINRLAQDANWVHVFLSICDENHKSYWPEKMSNAKIAARRDELRKMGLGNVFDCEYRGKLVPADATFQHSHFNYYEETDLDLSTNPNVENFVLVDPAKTSGSNLQASESAVVGVGVNLVSNAFYVRDVVVKRMRPDVLFDEVFKMADRVNARIVGIEVTGLEDFIVHPFQCEVIRRGSNIELIELKARGHKLDRIAGLINPSRLGRIHYNKHNCGRLTDQLLSYPYGRTDAMDAFAYIIPLLEQGRRYFSYESDSKDKKESRVAIEKEYEGVYSGYEPRVSANVNVR